MGGTCNCGDKNENESELKVDSVIFINIFGIDLTTNIAYRNKTPHNTLKAIKNQSNLMRRHL